MSVSPSSSGAFRVPATTLQPGGLTSVAGVAQRPQAVPTIRVGNAGRDQVTTADGPVVGHLGRASAQAADGMVLEVLLPDLAGPRVSVASLGRGPALAVGLPAVRRARS